MSVCVKIETLICSCMHRFSSFLIENKQYWTKYDHDKVWHLHIANLYTCSCNPQLLHKCTMC